MLAYLTENLLDLSVTDITYYRTNGIRKINACGQESLDIRKEVQVSERLGLI